MDHGQQTTDDGRQTTDDRPRTTYDGQQSKTFKVSRCGLWSVVRGLSKSLYLKY
jgi:hypothetical protein